MPVCDMRVRTRVWCPAGTVARAQVFSDVCGVLLVGGANGLQRHVAAAFQFAQLRDPLDTIAKATGETLSGTIAADVLALPLDQWTVAGPGAISLDALATEAARQLGALVNWRFLEDGSLWMGRETWPTATLPETDQVLDLEVDYSTPEPLPLLLTIIVPPLPGEWWAGKE